MAEGRGSAVVHVNATTRIRKATRGVPEIVKMEEDNSKAGTSSLENLMSVGISAASGVIVHGRYL